MREVRRCGIAPRADERHRRAVGANAPCGRRPAGRGRFAAPATDRPARPKRDGTGPASTHAFREAGMSAASNRRGTMRAGVVTTLARTAALVSAVAWAAIPAASDALTISGSVVAEVSNQGNPVTEVATPVTTPGSFSAGPITGSSHDNTTEGEVTVALGPLLPSLAASASGHDAGQSIDAAHTNVNVSLSYGFTVIGPQPAVVPVLFEGSTFGSVSSSGDVTRLVDTVGTRLRIVALNIAGTFAPVGLQGGQAPDYYASNAGMVNLGWGAQAFGPVPYGGYVSSFLWGADIEAGQSGTITLSTSMSGGTAGVLQGNGIFASGIASTMIDPRIYIAPDWLADHPGYAIVVEAGVGNVGPVPEPATTALLGCGLAAIGFRRLARRRDEADG
jgi:hypothetical protein